MTYILARITRVLALTLLFWGVFTSPLHALTKQQAQEIRYAKALVAFSNQQQEEGLKLLRENLKGPFHYKTEKYLAQYFFEKRKFTKSFRLYQHMLKNTYSKKVIDFNFNHELKNQFINFVRAEEKPSPLALQIAFEAAEKFYEAYLLKIFPDEFSMNLLNLSEKYFTICVEGELYLSPSKFYLSKIYFERRKDDEAISLLKEAKEDYSLAPEKNLQLGLKVEDIELLLGEALARAGYIDSGTLIIRSLYSRDGISSNTKSYAKSFLDELNTSYFNAIITYQLKQKNNIHQLDSDDYSNFQSLPNNQELVEKDAIVHHRRFHFYMNQRLSEKYHASGNFTYVNETPSNSALTKPGFDQTNLELELKRFRQTTSFYGLGYRFNNLAGRELNSLNFIQAEQSQTFTPHYYWITENSKWKLSFPIEFRTYLSGRKATSLAMQLDYKPILSSSWWSPSLFSTLGRRTEGDNFNSSLFFQLGLSNSYEISDQLYWLLVSDYFSNSNSDFRLNYNELTISNLLSYQLKKYPSFSLELEVTWRRRGQDQAGTIGTLDIGAGVSYNF